MLNAPLPVPYRRQLDEGYCLPACAQMVLAYWNLEREQARLAQELKTIPGVGTPISNILRLASRKLEVTFGSGTLTNLRLAVAQRLPPIVTVKTGMLP